jgi:F0F1-type ATP synthase assembly protein I
MKWVVPSVWLIGIGWCFATPLVLGLFLGLWLDRQTGRVPLFVLLGIALGLAVGIYGSVRMLLRFLAETGSGKERAP